MAGAGHDYVSPLKFLVSYDGSNATLNAYRRELERLLQWSWHIRKTSIHSLAHEDIVDFIHFTLNPPLAWIGTKNVARFIRRRGERVPNPAWRPFVVSVPKAEFRSGTTPDTKQYTPSQAAVRTTFAMLSSFYDYFVQESFVAANPVALIRQKTSSSVKITTARSSGASVTCSGTTSSKSRKSWPRNTLTYMSASRRPYLRAPRGENSRGLLTRPQPEVRAITSKCYRAVFQGRWSHLFWISGEELMS